MRPYEEKPGHWLIVSDFYLLADAGEAHAGDGEQRVADYCYWSEDTDWSYFALPKKHFPSAQVAQRYLDQNRELLKSKLVNRGLTEGELWL